MAQETKTTTPEAPCAAEVVVVVEKEAPPQPEPEKAEKPAVKGDKDKDGVSYKETKVVDSDFFEEESNKVEELIDPEKKALDEFKILIQEALSKREFTAPPPAPVKEEEEEEEKKEEELKPEEKKKAEDVPAEKIEACVGGEEKAAPAKEEKKETAIEKVVEKIEVAVEEIKETIVHEVTAAAPSPPPPCEEIPAAAAGEPEEVSIWGIPLLADKKSDAVLLKFLRARDFRVKEAFAMLKSVVAWRKEFKIEELLLEEAKIAEGLEKVVYMHGADKEGHPVCYNAFGEFEDKDLYNNTFADAEKREKFLKWYIQLLEKNIRKLDFCPDGTCTIVQVTDLKNSPGLILFKKELRQATNQALQLLQDNYPEFVAKQVFINVPWWYLAYNRMISPFLTLRTKSKFVFAGSTRTAETLFKYIAPEQVPAQYGGLSKEGDHEFTIGDPAIEEIIKPTCKHTIELPITEAGTMAWEVRVVGWEVSYGAEFVPSAEGGYTWIVQKARKVGPNDEQAICCSFKASEAGKIVLTLDNQTSKKKKLLYRSRT